MAEALAVKKYYTFQLNELEHSISLLNSYLKIISCNKINSESLLTESSCYKNLISAYFKNQPDTLQAWLSTPYETNTNHPEHLIHKTLSGHYVRSKSEVIIANALALNKIPYRYECVLSIDNFSLYPDFTICHPKTMQIFYWEHFGMMDNQNYCENAYNKLKIYGNHNIIPSINLITTYETQKHPINSENIQNLIEEYFLN